MKSFILLIFVGLLAFIGKTVPIKLIEQTTVKKLFAQVQTDAG
jgi:hypothetical protein